MKGISHKQAVNFIHRRLDGILKEDHSLLLDEHLRSCASCQAYANEMGSLPAHLNSTFKERWDAHRGPSPKIIQNISAKARRIPMQQRLSSGMKLVTGIAGLAILAFAMNFIISRLQPTSISATEIANSTPSAYQDQPTGLLAFTSEQDGNAEIYTVQPDGSELTNLTNNPANDSYPFWSPDGRQIAFTSDRDGTRQIYTMNADGSNVVQITSGEGNYDLDANGHSPWSPDGSKLIVSHMLPGEQNFQLFIVNITDGNRILLTDEPGQYILSSWSADGTHIAFIAAEMGRFAGDLFAVGSDGSGLVKLTGTLASGEYFSRDYNWSSDGNSIFFATHKNEGVDQSAAYISAIYKAALDGSSEIAAQVTDQQVIHWWNGTSIHLALDEPQLYWTQPNGSPFTLKLCENNGEMSEMTFERSDKGNLVFGSNCFPNGWMLYWITPDGTTADLILDSIIPSQQDSVFHLTWSFDDRYLSFISVDSYSADLTETLYVVDIAKARENPSAQPLKLKNSFGQDWQPVTTTDMVEEKATPQPTADVPAKELPDIGTNISNGKWIAFLGGMAQPQSSTDVPFLSDVYIMQPGTDIKNLTQFPAFYYGLQWSPDGQQLLFLREDAASHRIDIMRHYAGASGIGTIARPFVDPERYGYHWSPSSDKIVFADAGSGNYDIYTVYADGRNDPQLTQLTNDPAQDVSPVWSPDGQQIAFQRIDGDTLSIYVMDQDGSEQRQIAQGVGKVKLHWAQNGKSVYASSIVNNWLTCDGCAHDSAIYRIDLDTVSVHQLYYETDPSQVFGWYLYDTPSDTLYFMRIRPPQFLETWGTWFQAEGDSVGLVGELDPQQTCKTSTGNALNEYPSPNRRFSLVVDFCAGAFDLYLADREISQITHINRLPVDTYGQGGNNDTIPFTWSPDGRSVIYDNGFGTFYLINLELAMQDSQVEPTKLLDLETLGVDIVFDFAWQPNP